MPEIIGKYKDIPFESIVKYGEISTDYEGLLRDVYGQNHEMIPYDILAHMLNIISYQRFIRNYTSINKNDTLEYGKVSKLVDREILDMEYSKNMLDEMVKYNTIPYQLDDGVFRFLTSEHQLIDESDPGFISFRFSITDLFNRSGDHPEIKRASNLFFMEALYAVLGKRTFSLEDVKITDQQLFQKVVTDAILKQATDIFIDPKSDHINTYFGIFNETIFQYRHNLNSQEMKRYIDSIIELSGVDASKVDWAAEGGRKDVKIKDLGNFGGRYEGRMNLTLTPQEGIVSPVIRVHDSKRTMKPLDDLKANDFPKDKLKEIMRSQNGIFIMAGATGQGKSTTLYSCLDYLTKLRPTHRIEEMSDPIEMEIDKISQLKLNKDMNMSFTDLAQSTTRRNPKVVFLGEINSSDSAEFAVDQAIKDLFVITTIHAGSSSLVPARIKGMTLKEPFIYQQFMELVKGIAHQRMLKKRCPECCEERSVEGLGKEFKEILSIYGYDRDTVMVESEKRHECPVCGGLGYLVDKPAVCIEVFSVSDTIRERLKREGIDNPRTSIDIILQETSCSGINDAIRYLKDGTITFQMLYRGYELFNLNKELILNKRR